MTNNQKTIAEFKQILAEGGVKLTSMIDTLDEDRQIKVLNKLIREMIA